MFGVPTDGLVWLLAGVGLGIFLAMGGFALVAAQDRRVHRRRIRTGRTAVAAAIAEEDARAAEEARAAEQAKPAPLLPKVTPAAAPKPAPAIVSTPEPAPPAPAAERKKPVPALRLGAALKAAGTAFVREAKVVPETPPADTPPAVITAPAAAATDLATPITSSLRRAPEPKAESPKPSDVIITPPPKPRPPVNDTMPATPLMSPSEARYEPVKDEVIKAAANKSDAFPVPPRKAHINELPPIVDNDIVVEPPALPKPKKPLSEKEEAIAAAAARRRAVAAEKEALRKRAEREAAEKAEAERIESERQAAEREAAARRAEAARRLAEREEAERIEAERLAAQQAEQDRIERAAREEQDRIERAAREEQERVEREEWEKEEATRRVAARAIQLREEAERIEAQRRVAERLAALREQEQRQAAEAASAVAIQPRPVPRTPSPAAARPAVDIEEMFAQAFGASIPTGGPRTDDEQS